MGLKEIYIDTRNWVDSIKDRDIWRALVNTALNLRFSISHYLIELFFAFVDILNSRTLPSFSIIYDPSNFSLPYPSFPF